MSAKHPDHRDHRLVRRRHHDGDAHLRSRSSAARGIEAAVIEGDCFHRYDRVEMRERVAARPSAAKARISAISAPRPTCSPSSRPLFTDYGDDRAAARSASTSTTTTRPSELRQAPGTFTPWERSGRAPTCFLRRPARRRTTAGRRRRPARRPAGRRRADHQPRVDPEAPPRQERCAATRRGGRSTRSCAACPTT